MSSTSDEQYLLELINDARLNPVQNASRYLSSFDPIASENKDVQQALQYFGVDGASYLAALSRLAPAQPLAFNDDLAAAARGHDGLMIADDSQSHQLPGENSLGQRVQAAGYDFSSVGENIFAYAQDPLYAQAAFMIDWGSGPGGMQDGTGHRVNIMNPAYREVGVGIVGESDARTAVGPEVITEDFAVPRTNDSIVLGVAYDDGDRDGFYSVGEGVGGLSVAVGGAAATSGDSGGYALRTGVSGRQTVVLSGAGLAGDVAVTLDLAPGSNVKLDVVDGHILRSSAPVDVSGPIDAIVGLGVDLSSCTLNGGAATGVASVIAGTPGDDVLTGTDRSDRFVFQKSGGYDEVANFGLAGPQHDALDFSAFAGVGDLSDLLRRTSNVDGQAVIHLGPTQVQIDGVTKGMLARHPRDFVFHA